jgi:isopentenyl-diphosphate delta-isomerase
MEYITIVDENGTIVGTEEKDKCHVGKGILHSAFLVMLFNERAQLMLARRSQEKMLWPDFWDGTVASHYHAQVPQMESVRQRILYETGAHCRQIDYLFKFRYQAQFEDVGAENEICDVFVAKDLRSESVSPNNEEISEFKFLKISELEAEIAANSQKMSPWFLIAFKRYLQVRNGAAT